MVFSCPASSENQYSVSVHFFERAVRESNQLTGGEWRVWHHGGLRERTKRDFSAPRTDTFAGAKVQEDASVCFGPAAAGRRNDQFAAMRWTELKNS